MPEKRARSNLSQALYNLRRSIGDHNALIPFLVLASCLTYINLVLGIANMHSGMYVEAENYTQGSLSLAKENTFRRLAAGSLLTLGWLSLRESDYHNARDFFQASVSGYRLVNHLDELGRVLTGLGQANFNLGEHSQGLEDIDEALGIGLDIRSTMTANFALAAAALLVAQDGDPILALELCCLVNQHPIFANSVWFEEVYRQPIVEFTKNFPREVVAVAQERGRERDLWETATELLEAIEKGNLLENKAMLLIQ